MKYFSFRFVAYNGLKNFNVFAQLGMGTLVSLTKLLTFWGSCV